jgi:outer membrane protein
MKRSGVLPTLSLIACVLLAGAVRLRAAEPVTLSLDDALRLATERNRVLLISRARAEVAEAKAGEAGAALLPSVKFEGSYRRLSDVDPFAVTLPNVPTPVTIAPTVLDNTTLRATLQQPLFTGFRLGSAARGAAFLADAARADRGADAGDVTVTVLSAYWGFYQTMENERAASENVARLESVERDTRQLLAAGLATRNDLLRVQVQLSSARLQRIDAANDAATARMTLNTVLGLPVDSDTRLSSTPTGGASGPAVPPGSADELVTQAFHERPELRALEARVDAADAGVTAARGGWWPQLFLNGNVYYSRPNARYQPTRDEFKATWDIGVVLQFDVWNWNTTGHQVDQARAQLEQVRQQLSVVRDNTALDVRRQHLAVVRADERVAVARLGIEQADENARMAQDRFRQGLATSTDVLDAGVGLLNARTTYTATLVERELAVARLRRAVGQPPAVAP